jgi:hypothetical protein
MAMLAILRFLWNIIFYYHIHKKKVYKVLVGKSEGKEPLGKQRRRWEDGIRMDLREIDWGSVEWIQLAQNRDWCRALVYTMMNLRDLAPLIS